MAKDRVSVQDEVTSRILAALEAGTAPWVKPWKSIGTGNTPRNATTNRPYSGGNVVILWAAAQANGWTSPLWMTYKQAQELGAQVRKGEKSTPIYYFNKVEVKDKNKPDSDETKLIGYYKFFHVFNIAQIEGLPEKFFAPQKKVVVKQRNKLADEFVKSTKARIIEGQGEAYYAPGSDSISIPTIHSFKVTDAFYSTLFHEMGHWTGAKHRLDRDLSGRFGDQKYAAEELVAELTAAFVCAEFGFDNHVQNVAYIANWIRLLKSDNGAFMKAATLAQKAVDHLRGLALADEPEVAQAA